MSYAEDLKKKLQLHSETDCVDIKLDMDDILLLADKVVKEYKEQNNEISDQAREIDRVTGELKIHKGGLTTYSFMDSSLLDDQIAQAFKNLYRNPQTNQVKLLQHLEATPYVN